MAPEHSQTGHTLKDANSASIAKKKRIVITTYRIIIFVGFGLLLVLAFCPPDNGLGKVVYLSIRLGMPREEVHKLVGFSPDANPTRSPNWMLEEFWELPGSSSLTDEWRELNSMIVVYYDQHSIVIGKRLYHFQPDTGIAPVDSIRSWLRVATSQFRR